MTEKKKAIYAEIADLALYALDVYAEAHGVSADTPASYAVTTALTECECEEIDIATQDEWDAIFTMITYARKQIENEVKHHA